MLLKAAIFETSLIFPLRRTKNGTFLFSEVNFWKVDLCGRKDSLMVASSIPFIFSLLLCSVVLSRGDELTLQQKRDAQEIEDVQAATLYCWVGTSNPNSALGFPAVRTNCSLVAGTLCQLTYTAATRVYEGSCVNNVTCATLYNETHDDLVDPQYAYVGCCNTSDCNGFFLANGCEGNSVRLWTFISVGIMILTKYL